MASGTPIMKLKPCPFCGHTEPEITRYGTRQYSTQYECGWCSCSLETAEEWDHGKQWNQRPVDRDTLDKVMAIFKQFDNGSDAVSQLVKDMVKDLYGKPKLLDGESSED
jgi:hypothetical protein